MTSSKSVTTTGRWRSGWWLIVALVASVALGGVAVWLNHDGPDRPAPADLHNGQVFIQDNLWSTATEQYAVWVGRDGTPYAGRRDRGDDDWDVADLGSVAGNPLGAPTAADLHNVYAIAVDTDGVVHVVGNTHGGPLRYIRSAAPGDIHDWVDASSSIPGPVDQVTYPRFVALPDGTLQFWYRAGGSGNGDLTLAVLDAQSGEWRSNGVIVEGRSADESPYPHHIAVDPRTGTIHLLFEWRSEGDVSTTNDVGYVQSSDGGATWQRSDGATVALPVTHDSAEVVIDTEPTGSGLVNDGGLALDDAGRPHAVLLFAPPDGPVRYEHVWREGSAWRREVVASLGLVGRPAVAVVEGRLLALGSDGAGGLAVVDVASGDRRQVTDVPVGWEACYDSRALALFGELETLVPDGASPRLVTIELP